PRSSRFVPGSSRRPVAASGTAFTQTAIFIGARLYADRSSRVPAFERERTTMRPHRTTTLLLPVLLLLATGAAAARVGGGGVPRLVFPVVGAVDYHDDFGESRPGGPHQGNDLLAAKRSAAVAAEGGTVEFWTTSPGAGCMLY